VVNVEIAHHQRRKGMRPKGVHGDDGPAGRAGRVGRVKVVQPKLPISRAKQPSRGKNINSHQIKAVKKHR